MKSIQFFSIFAFLLLLMPVKALDAASVPARLPSAADFAVQHDYEAAIVMDVSTNKILFEKNADKLWTAASLTKLVGALTFVDRNPYLDGVAAILEEDEVGGGRLRVDNGSTMTIRDLMYSSITGSANNAATALARLSGLGMQGFINAMNKKAQALGCTQSVFFDASGMDPNNQTTAREMLKIAKAAFADTRIQRPASSDYYTFTILNTGEEKTIKNTNSLLLDKSNGLYVTGGKTGFLYESRNNFVFKVRQSEEDLNSELLIVVLGAYSRSELFSIAQELAEWSWRSHTWNAAEASSLAEVSPVIKPDSRVESANSTSIPNGTLVKTTDSLSVWYIYNNKKYVLLDGVFLEAYFSDTPIKTISTTMMDALEDARPYTFDDGILLKSRDSAAVYYFYGKQLRPIISAAVFEQQGFAWDDIFITPQFVLDDYTVGPLVTADTSFGTQLGAR